MAIVSFRPGAYLLKETSGNEMTFEVDYDKFNIPPNAELEVNPSTWLQYDDTQTGILKVYRIAPKPFTVANSVGGNK